jgi:hypothetical protein
MEQDGGPNLVQSSEASHELADVQRLWEISEELTGVKYNWRDQAK